MSWLFSQALVEEYLGDTCLDGEQSAPLSGNNTQQAYCAPDKMTKFSRLSRFGMTYKPLTESRGEELLTLYLAGFHAKTFQLQEKEMDLMGNDPQCGNTWQGSLARLDPSTSLWRTAQCSLLEDLELSLQTFPRWGSMQNGVLYLLPILVQTIKEKEFGFVPTPTVCGNYNKKGLSKTSGDGLATWVKKWPTPKSQDSRHALNRHNNPKDNHWKDNLGKVVSAQVNGGYLNPTWVEWLMGFPLGWTDLKPLETRKSLCAPQRHGSYLNE